MVLQSLLKSFLVFEIQRMVLFFVNMKPYSFPYFLWAITRKRIIVARNEQKINRLSCTLYVVNTWVRHFLSQTCQCNFWSSSAPFSELANNSKLASYRTKRTKIQIPLPIWICLATQGGIRLRVGFQPLMVISPTASWSRWCMQVSHLDGMQDLLLILPPPQHDF